MGRKQRTERPVEWAYSVDREREAADVEGVVFVWALIGLWWGWGVLDFVWAVRKHKIGSPCIVAAYVGP